MWQRRALGSFSAVRMGANVLAVLVSLLALAVHARARPLPHYDLASLAFEADVIVVAERIGGSDDAATYRVVRVLAGQLLRAARWSRSTSAATSLTRGAWSSAHR